MQVDDKSGLFIHKYLKKTYLPESKIREYAKQIVSALSYLHDKKIMHCDIKPQNILIANGEAKLADFGSAQIYYVEDEDTLLKHTGTVHFLAPECFKQGKNTQYYSGRKADVWAFGLCIYALAFNRLPFPMTDSDAFDTKKFEEMSKNDLYFNKSDRQITDSMKNFLRHALELSPKERASIFDLVTDPWFSEEMF